MSWNDWILQKNVDFTLNKLGVSREEYLQTIAALSKSQDDDEPDWKKAGLRIKDTNDRKTGHLNLPLLTDHKNFHNMEPDEVLINREDMKSKKSSKPKKKKS